MYAFWLLPIRNAKNSDSKRLEKIGTIFCCRTKWFPSYEQIFAKISRGFPTGPDVWLPWSRWLGYGWLCLPMWYCIQLAFGPGWLGITCALIYTAFYRLLGNDFKSGLNRNSAQNPRWIFDLAFWERMQPKVIPSWYWYFSLKRIWISLPNPIFMIPESPDQSASSKIQPVVLIGTQPYLNS